MKNFMARELRAAASRCQGGPSGLPTLPIRGVALRTSGARHSGAAERSASARRMHAQRRMSSLSLPTLVTGDQVTDALGELVLDVPHRRAWTRHVGELRLMAAVLEDALNVLRKCPRSRAGREAREWVNSHDASWPFAFERICEAFEIDAGHVRQQLNSQKTIRVPTVPAELVQLAETG